MFSATDISDFLACPHTATLKQAESKGEIEKPFHNDPAVDLLGKLGQEHEQKHLEKLKQGGLKVVQIDLDVPWAVGAAETSKAMQAGAEVIYQAVCLDGTWGGRPDFLMKVNTTSGLGGWAYEATETKLSRSTKAGALLQLCFYSDMLSRLQGIEPRWTHVVLGGLADPENFAVHRYAAYFRKVRADFEETWRLEAETYPEPVEHCEVCSWYPLCDSRRRADDHLSFVAGITGGQAAKRISEGGRALEYPEDVFFLLDSVGDNLKLFMSRMHDVAGDCGIALFEPNAISQFPREFDPFVEISAYRDVLLHNPVIGRGVDTYIPRWESDPSSSPLERAKTLWSEAEILSRDELTTTQELFGATDSRDVQTSRWFLEAGFGCCWDAAVPGQNAQGAET